MGTDLEGVILSTVRGKHTPQHLTYVCNLRSRITEQAKQVLTDAEDRQTVARWEGAGRGTGVA